MKSGSLTSTEHHLLTSSVKTSCYGTLRMLSPGCEWQTDKEGELTPALTRPLTQVYGSRRLFRSLYPCSRCLMVAVYTEGTVTGNAYILRPLSCPLRSRYGARAAQMIRTHSQIWWLSFFSFFFGIVHVHDRRINLGQTKAKSGLNRPFSEMLFVNWQIRSMFQMK